MTETTPARTRTRIGRATLAATLLTGLALTVATPATANAALARAASATAPAAVVPATIRGPLNLTVSCNANIPKKGTTVRQRHTGPFKVKQNSSTPASTSIVWAVSGTGHSLPVRRISNGGTAAWTNVLPGKYTIWVHRSVSKNCNGIGFGDGNYNWNYTVTYRG
jgi:hypothetical protein